jgi:type IV pilus assembly protein PilC
MANYRYVAFDQGGQRVEGSLDAADEATAEEMLWEQGLIVAKLASERRRLTLSTALPTLFGVRRRDLIVFSQQLATLLTSGISILPALRLLAQQSSRRALREVLQAVTTDLEGGQALSTALAAHPLAFPDLYARTITVGERTGNLDDVLRQLATYLEKEQDLIRKLRDALTYPVFVLVVAVGVVIMMLTVALPPMVQLFETFDAELPWPTRMMIGASNFATDYGLYVLIGGLILAGLSIWWFSQPAGRRVRDAVLLRVPILGRVILQGQIARFARTASALVRAGLPLSEVMELVVHTTENVIVAQALGRVRIELLAGRGLSAPLAAERIFPALLAQMVRVGEETGTLEENLVTLADFYEEAVDRGTKLLVSLAEPALTIFIGAVVGFIAVSMVMPMYSILGEIK